MDADDSALREVIDLFVQQGYQERFLYLLEKPKRRAQLYLSLIHISEPTRPY